MRTVLASLAAAAALLSAGGALACSCAPPTSAAEQLAATDLAFTGRVLGTRVGRDGSAVTRFRPTSVIKGQASGVVAVTHHTDDATCGLTYRKGASVLVLADRDGGSWRTGLCSAPRFSEAGFRQAARARPAR
jgi:hypothetical protein